MRRYPAALLLALACIASPSWVGAEWPYLTEEASTLGEGRFSLSAGASQTFQEAEHLRGGEGVLWTFPEVEGTLGVGSQAEVSFQYELLWFDPEDERSGTYESGDLRLWTKLVLFPSTVQNLSLRFGVKLPNASNERGLGSDETDVFLSLLYGARLGPAQLTLNAGLGLLGDPSKNQSQDDVFTWGAALRAPLWRRLWVGAEGSGYTGPFGVDRKTDVVTLAAVADWRADRWRLSVAGRRGIEDSLSWGWVAGLTYER